MFCLVPLTEKADSGRQPTVCPTAEQTGLSSGNYNAAASGEDTTCVAIVVRRTSSVRSPLRGLSSPAALNPNIVREVK